MLQQNKCVQYTSIPLLNIKKMPIKEGNYRLIRNNFWALDDKRNILLYCGYSPMCNPHEQIARSMVQAENNPAVTYEMIDYAWLDISNDFGN